MSPRPRRTSMRAAERRRPGVAGSRFLRAEARSRRSPALPGGFDVNADAIPALCSCRLDATDHPHGSRARRCCHHRPGGNDARGIGSAPSSSTRLIRGFRVAPEALYRGSRRLPTPASWGQRRRIAALELRSPDVVGSSHRWTSAAAGHIGVATSARFPLGSSHRDDIGRGRRLPRLGRMPFPETLRTASCATSLPTLGSSGRPLPLATVRTRDELEAASPRDSLHSPLVPPRRCGACAPRRFDIAGGFGSGRERPSPRFGSHHVASCLRPRLSLAREPPPRHECRLGRLESVGSCSEEPGPKRDAHGHATRFAPYVHRIQRFELSMLPPTVTRLRRWVETMFRRSVQSRNSARRHEAYCGDARPVAARCSELARPAPPEGGSRSDKPVPTAGARSSLRVPLAAHPAEMLEDVATSGLLAPLDRILARPAARTAAGAGDR